MEGRRFLRNEKTPEGRGCSGEESVTDCILLLICDVWRLYLKYVCRGIVICTVNSLAQQVILSAKKLTLRVNSHINADNNNLLVA